MKALLTLLLAACVAGASAQCKPYKDEVDPFTKKRSIVIRTRPAVSTWFVWTDSELHIEVTEFGGSVFSIMDGAPVSLLFTDGSIMELHQVGSEVASYIGRYNWQLSTYLPITRQQLETLGANTVKTIRFQCVSGYRDRELRPAPAGELTRAAQCMLELIP